MQNLSLQQSVDFGVYLDSLKAHCDDYIFVISSKGEYLAETEDLYDRLDALGIGDEFFQ